MKKLYISIGIMLITGGVNAQNAIENSTTGTSGEFNFVSKAINEDVDAGGIGEGQTWHFENLIEGEHAKDWFGEAVEPIETMNADYFQEANLCLQAESGTNKFWKTEDTGLTYLGYETETAMLILNDPLVTMPFPFSYGQKHSDIGKGDLFGSCFDYIWTCELNSEVVGVGSLYLPGVTYDQAFKVKRETMIVKTSVRSGKDRIYTNNEYLWYVNGISGPVLEVREWTKDACYGPVEGKEVNFSTAERTADNPTEPVFKVNVYPNPATSETRISVKTDEEANMILQVRDITGKVLRQSSITKLSKGETFEMIDLTGFKPGLYTVEVLVGDNSDDLMVKSTQKLVVE